MESIRELTEIMRILRDPESGCPWDKEQNELTLREYILEEAYELVDAVDSGSSEKIKDELGDLLLQIIFISCIMDEKNEFNLEDVADNLKKKLISRHPHIFSNTKVKNSQEVKSNWEQIKKADSSKASILSDYPDLMPALLTAKRLSEQAASVGFDWENVSGAFEKVKEELTELEDALKLSDKNMIDEELGDLLFSVANTARKLKLNPELSLKKANNKFKSRFRKLEKICSNSGLNISNVPQKKLNEFWDNLKKKK